jgi:hypothetical protein
MGQKVVRFSDLTGEILADDEQVVRLVIIQHPDLEDGPAEIEAAPSELKGIEDKTVEVVTFEIHAPGQPPRSLVVDLASFDELATDGSMATVLKNAPKSYAKPARAKPTGEPRINYGSVDHAGKPHKGKTTDAEKQIVRDHLDAVNQRLQSEGLRTIDLDNPEHVSRYGLAELATATTEE